MKKLILVALALILSSAAAHSQDFGGDIRQASKQASSTREKISARRRWAARVGVPLLALSAVACGIGVEDLCSRTDKSFNLTVAALEQSSDAINKTTEALENIKAGRRDGSVYTARLAVNTAGEQLDRAGNAFKDVDYRTPKGSCDSVARQTAGEQLFRARQKLYNTHTALKEALGHIQDGDISTAQRRLSDASEIRQHASNEINELIQGAVHKDKAK